MNNSTVLHGEQTKNPKITIALLPVEKCSFCSCDEVYHKTIITSKKQLSYCVACFDSILKDYL